MTIEKTRVGLVKGVSRRTNAYNAMDAVREDLATIVFTKARRTTELVYTWAVHGNAPLPIPTERLHLGRSVLTFACFVAVCSAHCQGRGARCIRA